MFLDKFDSFSVFWFCALAGTGMFIIQFFLNMSGFAGHDDLDDGGIADSNNFKWLSKQTLTGFLMMFGWTGLACKEEYHLETIFAIIISLLIGLFTIFITGLLFKAAKKLQSTGNIFNIDDTVGKEAYVYQRIPVDGMGKISVSLHYGTFEINAVSNQDEISSFAPVQILKKLNDSTVVVTSIKNR